MNTKSSFLIALIFTVLLSSCSSIRVVSDYDKDATFSDYKTFAFYKPGIDKAEINDIDKKRILRAIEKTMLIKGFKKSESPDLLISIFTKSREEVNVYSNGFGPYGYGWGWTPFYWNNMNMTSVSTSTQGVLYIDLIDALKKELIWQGQGTGYLTTNPEKKENLIQEFVNQILEKYPPTL